MGSTGDMLKVCEVFLWEGRPLLHWTSMVNLVWIIEDDGLTRTRILTMGYQCAALNFLFEGTRPTRFEQRTFETSKAVTPLAFSEFGFSTPLSHS